MDAFAGCFTAPFFAVFTAMVVGMIAQTGTKTICGMLTGAGLAQTWSHDRAYRFFARAVWSIDAIGLTILDLVVAHLLDPDASILLAVDDTAHRRRGKRVHGASWIHDGSAPSRNKLALGHRWVIVGVVVPLPFMTRPVCLPVACRRWQGRGTASTVDLAQDPITTLATRLPGRSVHVVADAAHHGRQLKTPPGQITWTTRPPRNATQVTRYGRRAGIRLAAVGCLWYGAFGPPPVRMICVRDRDEPTVPTLALVTTDLTTTVAAHPWPWNAPSRSACTSTA